MFLKALIAVYLVVMVWLVRRQINQMQEKEEEEEGVRVVMADIRGKTHIRIVGELKKVFM